VLVRASLGLPSLELAKGSGEKARLPYEPLGSPIVGGAGFEHPERETLERADVFLVAAERVVEPQRLGHQARPQPERRFLTRVAGGAARHHGERLALGVAQDCLTDVEPLAQAEDELVGGGEVRKHEGLAAAVEDSALDGPHQLCGGSARRDDHEAVARVER